MGQDIQIDGGVKHSFIVGGNVEHGFIASRDLIMGDQHIVQEPLTFDPDLKEVTPPAWTTTPMAQNLARSLARDRLVVIAGKDLDDQTLIARHIAFLLREQLGEPVRVKEWYRSSDPQKIETVFDKTETTILLLPQVQPHHLGHQLNDLKRLLHSRGNYIVITTECAKSEWGIHSGAPDEHTWHELSWEDYYGRELLARTLLSELSDHKDDLPDWIPREPQMDSVLFEKLTVEETAARLKQPERIQRLVRWLCSGEASQRGVLGQIEQLAGDHAAIAQWYRKLDRGDQLLALGLVLFDGLPDDQIFAALEYLVHEAWRKSDPNIPLFDYKDLEHLSACFRLAESGNDGTRIESTSYQKCDFILRAGWEAQRRRLLAVVPAITHLLKRNAAQERARNERNDPTAELARRGKAAVQMEAPRDPDLWRFAQGPERELFSSSRRSEQLQRAIITSLSQIGLLSFEAVEASFLDLAVSDAPGLQTVVAKALAAWRGEGRSEKLFKLLQSWWKDGCLTESGTIAGKLLGGNQGIRASMRATVALTTGYALQYDQPNQMAPELVDLLRVILLDKHPAVRARVLETTLPLAAASHLRQLEPLLRETILGDDEFLYKIAFGASVAFSARPIETQEVIHHWLMLGNSQEMQAEVTGSPRDRLLSAVAMVYGYLRFDPPNEVLDAPATILALRSILAVERSPFVRTHTFIAMGLQAISNFDLVASTLMEFVSEITLEDRSIVVSILAHAYLKQREQLRGGDTEIDVEGRKYRVWLHERRPATSIESALYSWLRDDANPVAQQVAVQTFAAITASALEKRERELASQPMYSSYQAAPSAIRVAPDPPRLRVLSPLGHMSLLFAAPRQAELRRFMVPILAEAIAVDRSAGSRSETRRFFRLASAKAESGEALGKPTTTQKQIVSTVLARWKALGEESIENLAHTLSRAMIFFRWRWAIVLMLVLVFRGVWSGVADWQRDRQVQAQEQTAPQQVEAAPQ